MPALIVFVAGAAVMALLAALGSTVGTALAAGIVIGALLRPLVVGAIQNW